MGLYRWLNRWTAETKANRPPEGAAETPTNRGQTDEPPISLVLLLKQPRVLDAGALARAASEAFGVTVTPGEEVAGETPHFLLHLDGRLFAVHNVAESYFDNAAAVAAETPELRLRKAVARHRAWLSVDFLHAALGAERDPYPLLGKLAAALAGDDCLAVCVPARRCVYPYDESVPKKLRGADPLSALRRSRPVPVVGVRRNDRRLRAAVAEARRRWPEFVAAFEERQQGQIFSVKVPVREGRLTEHMWVSVSALENDMIYGRLDNEPLDVKRLHAGDRLRVPVGDLDDWLFTNGEALAGGFTIDVLAKRPRRR